MFYEPRISGNSRGPRSPLQQAQGPSEKAQPADTLTSDVRPPELGEYFQQVGLRPAWIVWVLDFMQESFHNMS